MNDTMGLTVADLRTYPFLSPNSRRFASYWTGLPKHGLVPHRASFDPSVQADLLRTYVILEIDGPDVVRFRLAGTAEVERYGREITGLNYLDFVAPERREAAARAFLRMVGTPCGMLAEIHSTTASGRRSINEALGFPMRDAQGRVRLLYFQSNTLTDDEDLAPEDRTVIRHDRVPRRVFVDIGAGLPGAEQDAAES